MKPEELYALYVKANATLDVQVEKWEDLDKTDKLVWKQMSEQVTPRVWNETL